jgi:hypothetical protein
MKINAANTMFNQDILVNIKCVPYRNLNLNNESDINPESIPMTVHTLRLFNIAMV